MDLNCIRKVQLDLRRELHNIPGDGNHGSLDMLSKQAAKSSFINSVQVPNRSRELLCARSLPVLAGPEHPQVNKPRALLARGLQPGGGDRCSGPASTGRSHLVQMNVFAMILSVCFSVPLPGLIAVTFYVSGSVFIVLGQFHPHLPGPKPQTSWAWGALKNLLCLSLQLQPWPTGPPSPLPCPVAGFSVVSNAGDPSDPISLILVGSQAEKNLWE